MFYAIAGDPNEILNETTGDLQRATFNEIPDATSQRRYENQIGYIRCLHGWIHHLKVFENSLTLEGQPENPLRCGIGTVLTELCLIDPDVNARRSQNDQGQGNRALEHLRGFEELEMVKNDCDKLVGLRMASNPKSTAHTYFTAAINMKYGRLLVDLSDGKPR